jgi:hypothetical protein
MICDKCQKAIYGEYATKLNQSNWLKSEVYHPECIEDEQYDLKEQTPEPLRIHMVELVGAKGKFK